MISTIDQKQLISALSLGESPAFLLGAGCSVSSGCPAASSLIFDFKKRIYCQNKSLKYDDPWIVCDDEMRKDIEHSIVNPTGESDYSYFFSKCFPSAMSRSQFIKQQFQNKSPSLGYLCFANYLIEHQIRYVLTTNFDHLVNKSISMLDANYDVVEVSENLSPLQDNKLFIFSLHGDYNYDYIQNTSTELKSLTNKTLQKFQKVECSSIVVMGYSGADDSVMNALTQFFRSNPNVELFWVLYGKSTGVSQKVMDLMNSCSKSAFVESTGFDDIFLNYYKIYGKSNALIDGKVENDEQTKLMFQNPVEFPGEIETNIYQCNTLPLISCCHQLSKSDSNFEESVIFYNGALFGFLNNVPNSEEISLSKSSLPIERQEALLAKFVILSSETNGLKVYRHHIIYQESGEKPYEALRFSVNNLNGIFYLSLEPTYTFGEEPDQKEFLTINSKLATIFSNKHEEMLKRLKDTFFGHDFSLKYLTYQAKFNSIPLSLKEINNELESTFSLIDEPIMSIRNHQSKNQIGLTYDYGPEKILFSSEEIKAAIICPYEDRLKFYSFLKELIEGLNDIYFERDDIIKKFPGFENLTKIKLVLTGDSSYRPSINLLKGMSQDQYIDFLLAWMQRIEEKVHPSLYLIFFPEEIDNLRNVNGVDLHDRLKYKCLSLYKTQLIDEKKTLKQGNNLNKALFNLAIAIYTKTIGMPWKPLDYNPYKFFLGMAFGQSKNGINLSCSQLFDGAGRGMKLLVSSVSDKFQKNPYLSKDEAYRLGSKILQVYYQASLPVDIKSIVIHRTVPFKPAEIEGFKQAFVGLDNFSLLQIIEYSDFNGYSVYKGTISGYPQKRGTVWKISDTEVVLWTDGSVRENDVLPGRTYRISKRGITTPIMIRKFYGKQSIEEICSDILRLSKMDFNSASLLYSRLPVTLKFAKKLSSILKNESVTGDNKLIDFKYIM